MKCFVLGKTCFQTEQVAKEQAIRFSSKQKHMRAYRCEFCNKYHLTHKKVFKTM